MSIKENAVHVADLINEKKGKDIVIMDVSKISSFTDYFVIAHGGSDRQLKTLADEVEKGMEQVGISLYHKEGKETSGWILLDYGDIVVHLFLADQRAHYNIEKLWNDGEYVSYEGTKE